jgi:hypothetical protein
MHGFRSDSFNSAHRRFDDKRSASSTGVARRELRVDDVAPCNRTVRRRGSAASSTDTEFPQNISDSQKTADGTVYQFFLLRDYLMCLGISAIAGGNAMGLADSVCITCLCSDEWAFDRCIQILHATGLAPALQGVNIMVTRWQAPLISYRSISAVTGISKAVDFIAALNFALSVFGPVKTLIDRPCKSSTLYPKRASEVPSSWYAEMRCGG